MSKHPRLLAIIAWSMCAIACLVAIISIPQSTDPIFNLIAILFAITAGFIISRQPGNVIGWLMMIPPVDLILSTPIESYFSSLTQMPTQPSILVLLMAWFLSWNWLGLIFPVFLIPLLFPNGRLPSARWRWVIFLAAALCIILLFFATFTKNLGPSDGTWSIPNPIGFLDDSAFQIITIPWAIGLTVMTLSSLASIFVRYRRAGNIERQQIKWLLYACALFAIGYIPGIFINTLSDASHSIVNSIYTAVFGLSILAIPISVAIAILRYRLWDIDLIIRRSLVYGVLSAALALVYFGGVTLFQWIFTRLTGQQSPAGIVISTLAIVVLFSPLRRRVQAFIDMRFYRRKYDAARAVEEFSSSTRREVELDRLTTSLVSVIDETVQPAQVSVWIRPSNRRLTGKK